MTRDAIETVCENLRTAAAARMVLLVDLDRRVIAHANGELHRLAFGTKLEEIPSGPGFVSATVKQQGRGGISAPRAILIVGYQRDETSLGLVRLRTAKAVEALERILADDEIR